MVEMTLKDQLDRYGRGDAADGIAVKIRELAEAMAPEDDLAAQCLEYGVALGLSLGASVRDEVADPAGD